MNAMVIHLKFTEKVKNERKSMHEVLLGIIEIEDSKTYAEFGYSSLYDYLIKEQKYAEGSAQRRISSARFLREIPEIKPKLEKGYINLTQLSKLSTAIKQEQKERGNKVSACEKKELIAKIENKTSLETEKVLQAELNYEPPIKEKITPKGEHVFMTLKMTQAQFEKLQRAQNILSHVEFEGNYTNTIEAMCDQTIATQESSKKRKEKYQADKITKSSQDSSLKKEDRNQKKEVPVTATTAVTGSANNNIADKSVNKDVHWEEVHTRKFVSEKPKAQYRPYIPKSVRQFVFQRAGFCCEYVSKENGRRCNSQYQLQTDHVLSPKSKNNFS